MILALIDKVTTGTLSLGIFIWNVAPIVYIAATSGTGGLAFRWQDTAAVIDISDIIHSFDYDKSSSASRFIKGKSRNHKKLLKYFYGATTSGFKVSLSSAGLPVIFFSYSKDLLVIVLLLFILLRLAFSIASSFSTIF